MFINGIAIFFIVAQKKDDCWTNFKRVTQFDVTPKSWTV